MKQFSLTKDEYQLARYMLDHPHVWFTSEHIVLYAYTRALKSLVKKKIILPTHNRSYVSYRMVNCKLPRVGPTEIDSPSGRPRKETREYKYYAPNLHTKMRFV